MPETAAHCLHSQVKVQWSYLGTQWGGWVEGWLEGRFLLTFKTWFLILVQKGCGLESGGCKSSSPRPSGLSHKKPSLDRAAWQRLCSPSPWELCGLTAPDKNTEHLLPLPSQTCQCVARQTKARRRQFPVQPRQPRDWLLFISSKGAVMSHLST